MGKPHITFYPLSDGLSEANTVHLSGHINSVVALCLLFHVLFQYVGLAVAGWSEDVRELVLKIEVKVSVSLLPIEWSFCSSCLQL